MQIQIERISPVMMEFKVEVPHETVRAEVDKAYATLGRTARVKGFRPGKTPRDVLKHLFGSQVAYDVANAIVNETLPKALSEKNVIPVSQPNVETGALDMATAFSYKARFEVQPDIEEVKFEGLELKKPKIEVDEKAVDTELENLRTAHAALKAPEPARAAKAGDVVTINFTLSVDGKNLKDAGGEGVQIEVGVGQALPELDAALTGKSLNDTFTCDAKFNENHPRKELKGKTATFSVTLVDLKERVPPALDDEFAKDVGQYQTLVELRADIHTKLEKFQKDRSETVVAEQIVQKLNELNPCDVPPSLVDQQARIMVQELAMQARRMGQRVSADNIPKDLKEDAERKVRAGLLMAAIARKNEFKVTDEDMESGLKELAAETGKNIAKLRVEYREKSKRDILIGMILEDKILDFIEAKATITEGEPEAAKTEDAPKAEAAK